ncbi:MAG TPA: FG-GAP-like repeat-containing protein [Candidatus Limnocylindrales bacterium]|nr:FG-GAP-like repeat-containing protein [Candidatus Limnocylindrales bacterium]
MTPSTACAILLAAWAGPALAQLPHFTEVTDAALPGLATVGGQTGSAPQVFGGGAVGDCDGDDLPDLYFTGLSHDVLYRNRGDGTFEDITLRAGLGAPFLSHSAAMADIDNDGDLDILTAAGTSSRHLLYVNDGTCTFLEEAVQRGVARSLGPYTRTVSFGDYDRDGFLDIFVAEFQADLVNPGVEGPFSRLFRNRGASQPGYFDDVTIAAGLDMRSVVGTQDGNFAFSGRFTDLDGDGWPDLLIPADFGESRLFWNGGDGRFTDGTAAAGVGTDEYGMGATTADFDGDGLLDIFITSVFAPGALHGDGNRLYRNLGNRSFLDVTDMAGVRDSGWGWGVEAFDFDNDGNLDLAANNGVTSRTDVDLFYIQREFGGYDTSHMLQDPPRLWRNLGGGIFEDVAAQVGFLDDGLGQSVVSFDYDTDGDLDVLLVEDCCSATPVRLYRNDGGNAAHWIDVELRSDVGHPTGVGAVVTVTPEGRAPMVQEVTGSSTYLFQNGTSRLHFGLGAAPVAVSMVHVRWPDGAEQTVEDPPIDGLARIVRHSDRASEEADCIVALNEAGEEVVEAVTDRFVGCMARAVRGLLPAGQTVSQCLLTDPEEKIARAQAQTIAAEESHCTSTPRFGPASAAEVNEAMLEILRLGDLFGDDIDSAVVDRRDDRAAAACQMAVARSVARIARVRVQVFNKCKADGVRSGSITAGADLAQCRATLSDRRFANAVAAAERRATARCKQDDIAGLLPGRCSASDAEALFDCVVDHVSCGTCLAVSRADRVDTPCHRFVEGVASVYCGDRTVSTKSVARQWNEALLDAIRRDTPRPTVHARNLFHLSAMTWDAWRAYGGGGTAWLTDETHASNDPQRDREIAISHAAYRLLVERFRRSPGRAATHAALRALMLSLGLDPTYAATDGDGPAAVGNRIGAAMVEWGQADGSNELANYVDHTYAPINFPLIVQEPGVSMIDPNRWQPLALDLLIAQNGLPLPGTLQTSIGMQWNGVTPFALTRADPDALYFDPGPPPQLGIDDADYKDAAREVIEISSWLDPNDGILIDASPAVIGNNPLGTNNGAGHPVNPATGMPYEPNLVARGDYMRVLAEYWADGPDSETPPGHWNVIANDVSDALPSLRIAGSGAPVDRLEWDVKLYLALNGALHDAAIVAWGIKRHYDSARPISIIRYLGTLGQNTDPQLPGYEPNGYPLVPGLIEIITPQTTAPGQRHEHLAGEEGRVAIFAYGGPPADADAGPVGARWIRAIDWLPYQLPTFVTPAFPGYVSGHSTFSRAAAEVMTLFTGDAFVPGGLGQIIAPAHGFLRTENGPSTDISVQWATYYDAADLAGLSRLAGGIHITADDFQGRILGSVVGATAYDAAMERIAQ